MIEQEELDHQPNTSVNKEKQIYNPPILIIYETMMEIKSGNSGPSEHICGCGISS